MPRVGIGQEQTFEAADKLQAAGKAVTLLKVREALGTGSLTTIGNHLREWRGRPKTAAAPTAVVPEAVHQAAVAGAATIWRAAHDAARQEMESIRSACEAQVAEAEAERADALALADRLDSELHDANELRAAEEKALATACSQLEGLHAELRTLREELSKSQARGEEASRKNGELAGDLTRAQSEIGRLGEQLEREREEVRTLEGLRRDLGRDLEGARAEGRVVREQVEKLEAYRDEQARRIDSLTAALQTAHGEREEQRARRELVEERAHELRARAESAEARAQSLDQELGQARAEARAPVSEREKLERELHERR